MSANDRREVVTLLTHTRYNVQNFVYVRRRPFHPRRLFEFLHDKFILQHPEVEEDDEMDEDDDDDDEDNKSDTNMEDADNTNAEGAIDSDNEEEGSSSPSRAENSSTRDSVSSASSPPSSEDHSPDKDECELEIPDPSVVLANKKANPLVSRLFRSKGEYWLATRPNLSLIHI